jgi:hypothetical protein
MTFLARLIERHLGDAPASLPVLEPRLPSRFEPADPAAAPRAGEWDVEALRDPEPRVATAPQFAQVASRSREGGERPDGAMPRMGLVPTALGTVSAPLHAIGSHPAPAGRPRMLSPVVDGPPAAPARPSVAPAGPGSAPTSGAPDERPATRPRAVARPSLGPPVPASRAIRAERERAGARSGPTIHVTIGRVDVRAVMTPAAAPPRPAAPVESSSLEDYLRGRTGGRG